MISGDFFAKERMFRHGMKNDNMCEWCGSVETYEHLLWARKIWDLYNCFMTKEVQLFKQVNDYKDLFHVNDIAHVCKVKIKKIQELTQIMRPVGWVVEKIRGISREIKNIEKFNDKKWA